VSASPKRCERCRETELDSWDIEMAWLNPGGVLLCYACRRAAGEPGQAEAPSQAPLHDGASRVSEPGQGSTARILPFPRRRQ
jgi:hypothetical protein